MRSNQRPMWTGEFVSRGFSRKSNRKRNQQNHAYKLPLSMALAVYAGITILRRYQLRSIPVYSLYLLNFLPLASILARF